MRVAPYTRADVITDLYDIGDLIARGGFSEVYRGVHKKTGEARAVKIMEKSILTGKRGTMVARENEILRRCQHPNILKLHEVVETKTQMCLVMELVSGGDLYDYIVQRKSLTESEAAKITKSVLHAIEYLHGANPPVVHRDIKPENVLIEDVASENVKLSDFGLSKILVDPKVVECTPGGTSFYLPPEIIEGIKKHGARPRPTNIADMKSLDIWSAGIVLYILLCGSPPFKGSIQGQAERQRLLNQINNGVSFPENKWAGVSDAAKDMVTGMLQIDPTKRVTVRQALSHPWLLQQASNPSSILLKTPNVLVEDYKNKQEFNEVVSGSCEGNRGDKTAPEDAPQEAPKVAMKLTAPGASGLLRNRLTK